jgi:hypothetical protein
MWRFSVWMVAGAQEETLEAFDKFVTARQMRPGSLEVEKLCLPCGLARVLGAPLAVRCAIITLGDMLT